MNLVRVTRQLVLPGMRLVTKYAVRQAVALIGRNHSSAPEAELVARMTRDEGVVECLPNPSHRDWSPPH
jgi:hypothetical protein